VHGPKLYQGYRLWQRVRDHAFTRLMRSSFDHIGEHSVIELPVLVWGEDQISIGDHARIGSDSWLQAIGPGARLEIGDGTGIAGHCVLSAARSVRLGRSVLLARNVYISDHGHAIDRADIPIIDQGITNIAPVLIDDGAWLGQNVVILPGVTIGAGAVVGANSVVRHDVPPRCVAVGAPARVVRTLDGATDTRTAAAELG
jgi:lipopolysaccharide O-acetyltransferase